MNTKYSKQSIKSRNNKENMFSKFFGAITNTFLKKPKFHRSNFDNNSKSKSAVRYYKKNRNHTNIKKATVLKPSGDKILKAKLTNIDLQKTTNKKNKFIDYINHWKQIPTETSKLWVTIKSYKSSDLKVNLKSFYKSIFKFNSLVFFTKAVSSFTIIFTICFTIYLSYFDSYFLVDSWNINFTEGSYVDKEDINTILKKAQTDRQFLVFPSTSYWFINDINLTLLAKETNPYVEKIAITNREFPNKISLDITTEDILATLVINVEGRENQYWRISTSGEFIAMDESFLGDNLIYIDKVVSFDRQGASFKDVKVFEQDKTQLDRLFFAFTIKDILESESIGYKVERVSMPSLNTADYEVSYFLEGGTRLVFDSSLLDKKSTVNRIREISSTVIYNEIKDGKIKYIDLRLRKNIYICYQFLECNFN